MAFLKDFSSKEGLIFRFFFISIYKLWSFFLAWTKEEEEGEGYQKGFDLLVSWYLFLAWSLGDKKVRSGSGTRGYRAFFFFFSFFFFSFLFLVTGYLFCEECLYNMFFSRLENNG